MTPAERWTVVAIVLVLASLWPADRTLGLIILALAAAATVYMLHRKTNQ